METQGAFDWCVPTSVAFHCTYNRRLESFTWELLLTGEAGAVLGHITVPCGTTPPSHVLDGLRGTLELALDSWSFDEFRQALSHAQEVAGSPF